MTADRNKLGHFFVANGTISEKTLQRALERSERERKKIGVTLEEMGVVTGEEIAAALAKQFNCKTVSNIADHSYSHDLLSIISIDTATSYLLFPLKVDDNKLFLAVSDPTYANIISNIANNNDLEVVQYIAARGDIIAAINKHYLYKDIGSDQRKLVLIVEDSHAIRLELERILSNDGYRVVAASNGIEAFKKAILDPPDVILTDKEMPVLDGYRLLESLRSISQTRHIPVILLTSSQNGSEESDAFQKGFFDYIAKPVKAVTLLSRIKRALQPPKKGAW